MSAVSVLLIGASGAFGQLLLHEFIRQKSAFKRIAILAADEGKARTFANARKGGIEVIVGSRTSILRSGVPTSLRRNLQYAIFPRQTDGTGSSCSESKGKAGLQIHLVRHRHIH
jgi:hypothetical protein